jgi:hypothetical protein
MPFDALVDNELLSDLDEIRGIRGELGLNPYTVAVTIRVWSGCTRPGGQGGTHADTTTTLTNGSVDGFGGPYPIMVRQLSRREAIASGGMYTNRTLKVGPLTPQFFATISAPAGGVTDATLDPTPTTAPTEVFWNVQGPSTPAGGAWFKKVGEEATAIHYYLFLDQGGMAPGN